MMTTYLKMRPPLFPNAAGEYRFRMIHPNSIGASACHTIKMYQNGVYLGEAYYSGALMPEE